MHYQQDIAATGMEEKTLAPFYEKLKPGIHKLVEWKAKNTLPMLNLPEETGDLALIEEVGAYFRENFAHVLVVGTGGSSLGGQTVAALNENNCLPGKKGAPRLHFLDNVDPHTMDMILASLDLAETGCLVISKSGGTAEIIAQTLVILDAMKKKLGEKALAKHFISITIPQDNPLRRLSVHYGIRTLDHDPKVGGRFSVL